MVISLQQGCRHHSLVLIAIIVEVGGGLLLLVGFQTRIVALILAGFALAAALAFHNKFSDPNEMIHFLKE
jgi:putative oxidoreductase